MTEKGQASADPAHLLSYSDQATKAAQDVQAWVRAVFVPAVHAFLQGAGARPGFQAVDVGAASRLAEGLGGDVMRHVASAYYTDRRVRQVGELFRAVGSGGPLTGLPEGNLPPFAGAQDGVVRTSDGTLVALDIRFGAGLAHGFDPANPADLRELALHADDPLFSSGFFNALTPAQLDAVPWDGATVQALATAMAGGLLTGGTRARLVQEIRYGAQPGASHAILTGLAADPRAAAAFTRYLSAHPGEMKTVLQGGTDGLRDALLMFSKAVTVMDPAQVQGLLAAVWPELPHLDLSQERSVEGAFQAFLTAGAGRALPELPPRKPDENYFPALFTWAEGYGRVLGDTMGHYVTWLENIYKEHQGDQQALHALVENIVLGALGTALPGEGAAAVVLNGVYGGTAGTLQSLIDRLVGWSTGPGGPTAEHAPMNYLYKAAILALVLRTYGGGLGERTLPEILQDPGLAHVLSSAGHGDWPDPAGQAWARRQALRTGPGHRLEMLLAAMGANFK
ncbi:hypothetical protein [Streptomyces sp. NPDC020983]|uniref:hypothetical protein n=1 Tax=Streptomyces sp. NPDC020983 TaxID=3365106 RepID=UPI0037A47E67